MVAAQQRMMPAKTATQKTGTVGAEKTERGNMLREQARQLDIPMRVSKGQAEGDFDQIRDEREIAKMAEIGAPMRGFMDDQHDGFAPELRFVRRWNRGHT